MTEPMQAPDKGGIIAWMVHNRVTPNILMLVCILGGWFYSTQIKKEVFPSFDQDLIRVNVPYPGASPEEVEQGILLAIEERVRSVDGVEDITSTANEGSARVDIEIDESFDKQRILQDIKQEIDRIRTLPKDAEDPEVEIVRWRRQVMALQLYGDVSDTVLRATAEQTREALLLDPNIGQVDLAGVRDIEVHIEVSEHILRQYKLQLSDISSRIASEVVEIPGGSVETQGGEILVRVRQRSDWAREFAHIPIIQNEQGVLIRLGDIASVTDGFEDSNRYAYFNGVPAIGMEIYRVGEQTPLGVADAVMSSMQEIESALPLGIDWAVSNNRSDYYKQRMQLLFRNAFLGLILVLTLLGIFLELKLAFWVTMGIPISFLGCLPVFTVAWRFDKYYIYVRLYHCIRYCG